MLENNTEGPQRTTPNFSRTTDRHDVPDGPVVEAAMKWLLDHSLEHLHGPETIAYKKDELVVLCLLRNGGPFVEAFVEHYSSLGAKHLVFLDNGSEDGTIEILKGYENVTVLRSQLPYKKYQIVFKKYLIERFGRGRWSLYVDVDELFDYPFSDVVGLGSFLGYLNGEGYTAVVAYMLDMFSEKPLSEEDDPVPLKESHRFCDISNVLAHNYREVGDVGNVISNEEIEILRGGVQGRLFGIYPILMKHPLIFLDDEIKPMDLSDHWVGNARVADVTGVLFHYKLSSSLFTAVRREVEEKRYVNRRGKYEKYLSVLEENPSLSIKGETAREVRHVNDLVGTRFLIVSEKYIKFVAGGEREEGYPAANDGLEKICGVLAETSSEAKLQNKKIEELQKQVRQLHRQQERSRRQSLRQLRRQQKQFQQKISRLQDRLKGKGRGAPTPENRNRALKERVENLEHQIKSMRSSRTWRLISVLGRIKNRVLQTLR